MPGSPIPQSETDLVPWLVNFSAKLPNYSTTLGFTAAELAQTQKEVAYLVYVLNVLSPTLKQTVAAVLEYKSLMKEGDAAAVLPITLPGTTLPPAAPSPPPAPGVLPRLRKLAQNIKSRPNYTEPMGQDLGIISGGGAAGPEVPTLTEVNATAGVVTLGWNKGGWTGVRVQSRAVTGGTAGNWSDLGVDLYSPFVDTRPLAALNQPEAREYRAAYLDGDTALSAWSQTLAVTVTP